jgi:hypothetical protein
MNPYYNKTSHPFDDMNTFNATVDGLRLQNIGSLWFKKVREEHAALNYENAIFKNHYSPTNKKTFRDFSYHETIFED